MSWYWNRRDVSIRSPRIMGGENPSVLLLETAREELKRWQKDLLAEGEDGQET